MRTRFRATAASVAVLATFVLTGCTTASAATHPTTTEHSTATAPTDTATAARTYATCQLADMYFSMLRQAVSDQTAAGSAGDLLYAQDVNFAQVEENQLDAAGGNGTAVFASDIAGLRSAAQQSKPPHFTLPAPMEQPYVDARDPRIAAAVAKLRTDCIDAGQQWGIYTFGG